MTKGQLKELERTRKACEAKYGFHRDRLRRVYFRYNGGPHECNIVLIPHESLAQRFYGTSAQITHNRATEL